MRKSFAKIQKPAKTGLNILAENQPKPNNFASNVNLCYKSSTCSMARMRRTALDRWARLLLHFCNQSASAYGLNSHLCQSAYGLQYVACTCCTEFRSFFEAIGMDELYIVIQYTSWCLYHLGKQSNLHDIPEHMAPSNLSWMWIVQLWRFGVILWALSANWVVLQCHNSF